MRKFSLTIMLVVSLLLCMSYAAMAEVGFHVGLGYNSLSNELSIGVPEDFQLSLNTPVKMYTLDLGYDFSDKFAINAQYSWGTSDVASFETDYFGGTIEKENTNWRVEGSYKVPVGKKVKLGLVAGYANYETIGTLTGYLYYDDEECLFSGSLKQSLDGAYIGPTLIYTPNDKFELGAIYRWMIDPDGKLEATIGEEADYYGPAAIGGEEAGYIDLEDLNSSSLELYAKAKLNECWSAKVGYTYTWIDYSLGDLDISNETSGLYAMLEYRF